MFGQQSNNQVQGDACPECGTEWSSRVEITRGDRLMDTVGLTLFDIADKHTRVCSSKEDASDTNNILGQGEYYLYFHK